MVITDNEFIFNNFRKIIIAEEFEKFDFNFSFSKINKVLVEKYKDSKEFVPIDVKEQSEIIKKEYQFIISLHCKQIFPEDLVNSVKCINVHPGLNPYNRGWFPQVFSILNKMPCGATIHWIDAKIDHGNIIVQEKIESYEWDTSLDIYNRVLNKEVELLKNNLYGILTEQVEGFSPEEGNINYLQDFKNLCKLDLEEKLTLKEAIDKLRALSHGEYKNAYYETAKGKIYLKIELEFVPTLG